MSARPKTVRCLLHASRIVAAGILLAPPFLAAHDGPNRVIEALTTRMDGDSATPLLLYRRALEYRALGRLDLAAADLTWALQLDPAYLPALVESSKVGLCKGRISEALEQITRAIDLAQGQPGRAALHLTRARIHEAAGNFAAAHADCERAFESPSAPIDWYLTRSRVQFRLGRHDTRIADLKRGVDTTGSVVLETEWIEAMIDSSRHAAAALAEIEARLGTTRWQSSWLIRRARARIAIGDKAAAVIDLHRAMAEIDERLRPERPDLMLLADRGVAHALLGDVRAARHDLLAIREKGGAGASSDRLAAILETFGDSGAAAQPKG